MATEGHGSISRLIGDLKHGADVATRRLWERYFERLARLARGRLRGVPRTVADEEDVALSAFDSFFAGVARGQYPRLDDRDDLWRVLATIAVRKVADQAERETRLKRGGGRVLGEAALEPSGADGRAFDQVAGAEPTPELAAMMTEEVERLFELLPDESLRQVARMKLDGHTNAEIAAGLECSPRSVERRLERIRELWLLDPAPSPPRPVQGGPVLLELRISEAGRLVYLGQFDGPIELGRQHGAESDPYYRLGESGRWRLIIAAKSEDGISRRQVLLDPEEEGEGIRITNLSSKMPLGLTTPGVARGENPMKLRPGASQRLRLATPILLDVGRLTVRVSAAGESICMR